MGSVNRRKEGSFYERRAGDYLTGQGLTLVEFNFSCRLGEIDLVAREGPCLVFVEVKYRRSRRFGLPEEAVGPSKMRTIRKVADYYCLTHGICQMTPVRFDLVAIEGEEIRHYRGAF